MCPYTRTPPFVWYYLNEQCCHSYSVKDHSVMYTLNFNIIKCTSVKNSLKSNRENLMSCCNDVQWSFTLSLGSIANRMTVHDFFNSMNIWKVQGVGSLLVVLSLKNKGPIIFSSFTLLLHLSIIVNSWNSAVLLLFMTVYIILFRQIKRETLCHTAVIIEKHMNTNYYSCIIAKRLLLLNSSIQLEALVWWLISEQCYNSSDVSILKLTYDTCL